MSGIAATSLILRWPQQRPHTAPKEQHPHDVRERSRAITVVTTFPVNPGRSLSRRLRTCLSKNPSVGMEGPAAAGTALAFPDGPRRRRQRGKGGGGGMQKG
jgi:hypothetical protein